MHSSFYNRSQVVNVIRVHSEKFTASDFSNSITDWPFSECTICAFKLTQLMTTKNFADSVLIHIELNILY